MTALKRWVAVVCWRIGNRLHPDLPSVGWRGVFVRDGVNPKQARGV